MPAPGVTLCVAALLALAGCGSSPPPHSQPLARCEPNGLVSVGEQVPVSCVFERFEGGTIRLGDLVGKPAVLNFWATWCTFCIKEMPAFQKVFASVGDRVSFVGADLLGVQGETRGAAKSFARSTGVRYTLIYDDGGLLYSNFSPRLVMPVTIFVGADGRVAHRVLGPLEKRGLRELIAKYLGVG